MRLLRVDVTRRMSPLTSQAARCMTPRCRCTERSALCGMNHTWDWLSQDCGQQRLGKRAIQELLRNKTVVISGDSHVRKLYNQFAKALGEP